MLAQLVTGFQILELYEASSYLKLTELTKEILTTENERIADLTPLAIIQILRSDEIHIDELDLFLFAAEWADNYALAMLGGDGRSSTTSRSLQAIQQITNLQPSETSAAAAIPVGIVRRTPSFNNPVVGSQSGNLGGQTPGLSGSDSGLLKSKDAAGSRSNRREVNVRATVHSVVANIRFGLLTPTELRELENNQLFKALIPPESLADAWRILAFKQPGTNLEEKLNLQTVAPKKRGGLVTVMQK